MPRSRTVSASFARVRLETRLLYDWLRDHHDDFTAELERTRVHDRWKLAMKLIAHHKLLDSRGNPPTQDTAIRTWKQVRADVAAARAKRQIQPPTLAPGEIAPGVRATAQASAWASTPVRPPPSGQAPLAVAQSDLDQDGDDNHPMRRLRAAMQKDKVPMPKPM